MGHEGEVLAAYVSKARDKKAALTFLRKLMKRHGQPEELVTDKLRTYGAALKEIGAEGRRVTKRWPTTGLRTHTSRSDDARRRRSRRMHSLQKVAAVHGSVHNHLNAERGLTSRDTYKAARTASLTEWRRLCAD